MILYRKLTPSNNPDMVYYNDNNKANQIMNNINNIMNNKIDKKYKIGDTKQVEDSKNIDEIPKIIFINTFLFLYFSQAKKIRRKFDRICLPIREFLFLN